MLILRQHKGSELTFDEVDNNWKSLYYSSSLDSNKNILNFHFTNSNISHSIDLNDLDGLKGFSVYDKGVFISYANQLFITGSAASASVNGPRSVTLTVSSPTDLDNLNVSNKFTSSLFVSLPPGYTFGKYENGDEIPATGLDANQVIDMALRSTLYPEYVDAAMNLSSSISLSSTREVGSKVTFTLTANFNPGRINGKFVGGVWDHNAKQANRAGDAYRYEFNGTPNSPLNKNNITYSNYEVQLGKNNFTASVYYEEGPQPKDSTGADYGSPLPSGSITRSTSFPGSLKVFYGTGSEDVPPRTLNSGWDSANGTVNLKTGTSANRFHFFCPLNRELTNVFSEAIQSPITSQYEYMGTASIVDGGSTYRVYKHYMMSVVSPYNPEDTHRIEFKSV